VDKTGRAKGPPARSSQEGASMAADVFIAFRFRRFRGPSG